MLRRIVRGALGVIPLAGGQLRSRDPGSGASAGCGRGASGSRLTWWGSGGLGGAGSSGADPCGSLPVLEESDQRHIRQHMTARPGIIMPAFPGASKEVGVGALVVIVRNTTGIPRILSSASGR